jgi:hypothetical protein
MSGFAVVAVVLLTLAQGREPSARELLNAPRVLTPSEVAAVLSRSQDALTRKTLRFRLIGGTDVGPQILMGVRGQPKIVRWAGAIEGGIVGGVVGPDGKSVPSPSVRFRREYIKIIEFTGRPALRCGESAAEGELVVEYEATPASKEWTAIARQRTPHELGLVMTAMLEMLQGALTLSSGERRRINGRWARAFVSSWTPAQPTIGEAAPLIGDPTPNIKGEPIRVSVCSRCGWTSRPCCHCDGRERSEACPAMASTSDTAEKFRGPQRASSPPSAFDSDYSVSILNPPKTPASRL